MFVPYKLIAAVSHIHPHNPFSFLTTDFIQSDIYLFDSYYRSWFIQCLRIIIWFLNGLVGKYYPLPTQEKLPIIEPSNAPLIQDYLDKIREKKIREQ